MNIGDAILNEIISQPMFRMECPDAPESGCIAIWNGNVAEQLEALIAAHGYVLPTQPDPE